VTSADARTIADLRRAADKLAIIEVIGAYGFHLDTMEFEAFDDLFTEDVRYDITPDPKLIPLPLAGRDAVVGALTERRRITGDTAFPRHLATNVVFRSLDETSARTASFLVVIFTSNDGQAELRRTGIYVDELRKEDGRWRFASRHLELDLRESDHATVAGT
jgi:hypothetical protein